MTRAFYGRLGAVLVLAEASVRHDGVVDFGEIYYAEERPDGSPVRVPEWELAGANHRDWAAFEDEIRFQSF